MLQEQHGNGAQFSGMDRSDPLCSTVAQAWLKSTVYPSKGLPPALGARHSPPKLHPPGAPTAREQAVTSGSQETHFPP